MPIGFPGNAVAIPDSVVKLTAAGDGRGTDRYVLKFGRESRLLSPNVPKGLPAPIRLFMRFSEKSLKRMRAEMEMRDGLAFGIPTRGRAGKRR
jgi:hypothetical protein